MYLKVSNNIQIMDLTTLMNSTELTDEQKVQLGQLMGMLNKGNNNNGINLGTNKKSKSKIGVTAQQRNDMINQMLNATNIKNEQNADEKPTIDELKKRLKMKQRQSQMLRTNTTGLKQKYSNQNNKKTNEQQSINEIVEQVQIQDDNVNSTSKITNVLNKLITTDDTNDIEQINPNFKVESLDDFLN